MPIEITVLHPGEDQSQTVAILLLIYIGTRSERIALVNGPALQQLIAREDTIDDMLIRIGRTNLDIDRLPVARELAVADIEPVMGLHHRMLVVNGEHDEILLQLLRSTHSCQPVTPRRQCLVPQGHGGVGLSLHLPAAVNLVGNLPVHVMPRSILQGERHLGLVRVQQLLRKLTTQRRGFRSQRQADASLMGFSTLVGYLCLYHKLIEQATQVLIVIHLGRKHHRHLHLEAAVVSRHGLTAIEHLVVSRFTEPPAPPSLPARHLVLHFRTLYGHAGIALGQARDHNRVAAAIGLFIVRHLHLESRPFVFLHTDRGRSADTTTRLHMEHACQAVRRQSHFCRHRTIAVGHHLLFSHRLVVGITQQEGHALLVHGLHRQPVGIPVIHDGRYVHSLARTIEAPVGIDSYLLAFTFGIVIAVGRPEIRFGKTLVVVRIGIQVRQPRIPVGIDSLAFVISNQNLFVGTVAIVRAPCQSEVHALPGLSRRGIDRHIADAVIRQFLHHHIEVTHKE